MLAKHNRKCKSEKICPVQAILYILPTYHCATERASQTTKHSYMRGESSTLLPIGVPGRKIFDTRLVWQVMIAKIRSFQI
jgi:hypothetical protein